MASTLLLLDTRDGEDLTPYNTRFTVNFPTLNNVGYYAVSLVSIEFPNTVYPINSNNNVFTFIEQIAGVDQPTHTVTLPEQVYSGTTLAEALTNGMNNPDSTTAYHEFEVTYDSSTLKLTFVAKFGGIFYFVDVGNNIYNEIGFDTSIKFTSKVGSHVSDYPINVSGTAYVDLITNLATHNHRIGYNWHPMARIPIRQSFGNVIFYQQQFDVPQFVSAPQLDEIFIELRDADGKYYLLPENAHVSIVFNVKQILTDSIPNVQHFDTVPGAMGHDHVHSGSKRNRKETEDTTSKHGIKTPKHHSNPSVPLPEPPETDEDPNKDDGGAVTVGGGWHLKLPSLPVITPVDTNDSDDFWKNTLNPGRWF